MNQKATLKTKQMMFRKGRHWDVNPHSEYLARFVLFQIYVEQLQLLEAKSMPKQINAQTGTEKEHQNHQKTFF